MRQILMSDIRKRSKSLTAMNAGSIREQREPNWQFSNSMRTADMKRFIETNVQASTEVNLYQLLNLYEVFAEKATVSDISKLGHFIANEAVHKSRDTKQMQSLIKRRLTAAQYKATQAPITSTTAPHPSKDVAKSADQAVVEAYSEMLDKAIVYANCDRVLENYNKISKRFNLEVLINENTRVNGVCDTVVELCNRIDTYQMPNAVKFNTVIETAFYGFESNAIEYKKSDILETAVDYFLFKSDGRQACKEILEATLFFDKNEDMGNIDILMEDEPEENTTDINTMLQNHYGDSSITVPVKENKEFEDIFNKFKEEEMANSEKPESKLKQLISKLYATNVSSIVDETPNLLRWIRSFFIVGSIAIPFIGPVVAAVGFIADKFISLHMDRKEVSKMVKCFEQEIKATNKKISSTKDPDEIDRLKKYKKSLEEGLQKIDLYYSELLSEEEQEKMYDQMLEDREDDDTDDVGFDVDSFFDDDDDFDFGEFNEFACINKLGKVLTSAYSLCESDPISESMIYEMISRVDDDTILDLAHLASRYPDTFHKGTMKLSLEALRSDIRNNKVMIENSVAKSIRFSTVCTALNILEQIKPAESSTASTITRLTLEATSLYDATKAVIMLSNASKERSTNSIMEASLTNSLKLASMNLKKAMTNLKDKDRQVSQTIDMSMNNMKKGIEDSMTNDNREAIIKGSILPSASKVIKLGIVNAGLWAINPALSVIATLGYFIASSKFKSKERQMVIDELEIELKMCDQYIEIAKQKNDMKALKQLLQTQRQLDRQRQRIKYKMKVDFGQKYYDATPSND